MKSRSVTVRLAPMNRFLPVARRFTPILLLAGSLSAVPALGSPAGELDPAFGDHGRILLREKRFEELGGVGVFVDSGSGRLLAVASGWQGNVLLRFNSDGSLDPGFGDQGVVRLDFGDDRVEIYDVELLGDGRLLVAGAMNVYGDPDNVIHGSALLARMHADGTPDASFGSNGRAIFQLGGVYEAVTEILVQPDDRMVVFGSSKSGNDVQRILARYTKDGLLDAGFGNIATPGIGMINLDGVNGTLAAISQQSDGNFIACGHTARATAATTRNQLLAVRVHSYGLQDTTFGANGVALAGGWSNLVEAHNCLALADGHLVIAGTRGLGGEQRAAAFRLTPDGRLDASFGDVGIVVLPTESTSAAQAMLLMTDGMLAIAGRTSSPPVGGSYPWVDMLVTRLDPTSGEIDRGFGDGGATTVDFGVRGFAGFATPRRLRQQPDGKLVMIGAQVDWYDWYDAPSIAITRVDPYGAGSNGWAGLTETHASVPRDGSDVTLHIRRTGGRTGQLSVDYRTADDTAIAGTNYVASSGTFTWPDGDMSERTLSIAVLETEFAANVVYFTVELFNSSGGLAVDQTTIGISQSVSPEFTPPPPAGGNSSNRDAGGGAIGIEIGLLMVLTAFGVRHRTRRGQVAGDGGSRSRNKFPDSATCPAASTTDPQGRQARLRHHRRLIGGARPHFARWIRGPVAAFRCLLDAAVPGTDHRRSHPAKA